MPDLKTAYHDFMDLAESAGEEAAFNSVVSGLLEAERSTRQSMTTYLDYLGPALLQLRTMTPNDIKRQAGRLSIALEKKIKEF